MRPGIVGFQRFSGFLVFPSKRSQLHLWARLAYMDRLPTKHGRRETSRQLRWKAAHTRARLDVSASPPRIQCTAR
jgi:hypothetical protein